MSPGGQVRLDVNDRAAVENFIRANTKLIHPPLVPEIVLHLAEESLPIWQKTEEELGELNLPPPFWAFAWAGGQALARYLLDTPQLVAGKRVLDLGAGSGLTAIAAMKAGASSVLAADIDRISIAAVAVNAQANDVVAATTREDLLDGPPGDFGVVLIGDLFYERALADKAMAFVAGANTAGALVLVGDPKRSYFPTERFESLGDYRVPVTRELEDAEIKNTSVWRFSSR